MRDLFGNVQYRNMPVSVNEEALKKLAEIGGGKFFRATDSASLEDIFGNIDQLEKTEVKLKRSVQWRDIFPWIVAAGLVTAALQTVISLTITRTVP
jgi:Ca-activated chloride channel homolog